MNPTKSRRKMGLPTRKPVTSAYICDYIFQLSGDSSIKVDEHRVQAFVSEHVLVLPLARKEVLQGLIPEIGMILSHEQAAIQLQTFFRTIQARKQHFYMLEKIAAGKILLKYWSQVKSRRNIQACIRTRYQSQLHRCEYLFRHLQDSWTYLQSRKRTIVHLPSSKRSKQNQWGR